MELFNFHFANLKNKQLNYNQFTNTYNCPSGITTHHNYPSFKVFIENMMKTVHVNKHKKQLIIVETGTMAIYDDDDNNNENSVNSTLLFNNIVSKYGGILFTCDKDKNKIDEIAKKVVSHNLRPINMDSIVFLTSLVHNLKTNDTYKTINIHLYFDTYDKNKTDIQNANQCINEFNIIKPYLREGSQILINNAINEEFITLIKKELPNDKLVIDKNQLLYVF
jgi:hypothetical protein